MMSTAAADATGFGPGPLYPMTGGTLRLTHGRQGVDGLYEYKVVWASTSSYDGPVVVRVGRLDGPGRGLVRLYYEASASRGDAVVFTLIGLSRNWPSGTFVSGPGCYAYQLDGLNLTDTLVFKVVP
jgi:hypothetical protein